MQADVSHAGSRLTAETRLESQDTASPLVLTREKSAHHRRQFPTCTPVVYLAAAMFEPVTYSPWVSREGMRGWFAHLTKVWGNPNARAHGWPQNVLERVCERGDAIPVRFDRDCAHGLYQYAIIRENPLLTLLTPNALGVITNIES